MPFIVSVQVSVFVCKNSGDGRSGSGYLPSK